LEFITKANTTQMRELISFSIIFLILNSCVGNENNQLEFYQENSTSFFELRNSDWTKSTWIRKPKNLKIIHESFKKFGYKKLEKLIFKSDNEFIIQQVYIKRNLDDLLDSLELTYNNLEIQSSKYYSEFWNRRKSENTDSVIYEIIREINSIRTNSEQINYVNQFVNDTLVDLLKIEFTDVDLSLDEAKNNFNTLLKYGFHQSAYNLLFERAEYSKFELNRKKLKKELFTANEYNQPWLIDNEK